MKKIFEMAKENVSKAGYDIAMPAGVVLTGGSALLRNITKLTQSVFGVAARVGYPSDAFRNDGGNLRSIFCLCTGNLIKHALDDDVDVSRC